MQNRFSTEYPKYGSRNALSGQINAVGAVPEYFSYLFDGICGSHSLGFPIFYKLLQVITKSVTSFHKTISTM